MSPDAVVVGAGVAGLRCALALADAGLRVVVLEAAPIAGGRAGSWLDETTGLHVDVGPHVLSSEHRNFMAMLKRLGTADQVLWQRRPMITLHDGRGVLRMPSPRLPPPLHGVPMLPRALTRLSLRDGWSRRHVPATRERDEAVHRVHWRGCDPLAARREANRAAALAAGGCEPPQAERGGQILGIEIGAASSHVLGLTDIERPAIGRKTKAQPDLGQHGGGCQHRADRERFDRRERPRIRPAAIGGIGHEVHQHGLVPVRAGLCGKRAGDGGGEQER